MSLILSLILTGTVAASLPGPQHAKMIAVDMNHTLYWDCNYTQLHSPVNFTVDYTFSHEVSYKPACAGSSECRCDLSRFNLSFGGEYKVRVRAEAGNQYSNWTLINFTPENEVQLSSPRVNMKADRDMIILTISESVMSADLTKLSNSVQYWEKLKPQQKHTHVDESPHVLLSSLKSQTEYCVQVKIFDGIYGRTSNYSSPQCVYTTGEGRIWVWLTPLILLFGSAVVGAFIYVYYKCKRNRSVFTAPESILVVSSVPLLKEVQEECCTIAHVIPAAIPLTRRVNEEQEQEEDDVPELQAPESLCHWSDGTVHDSGFSSGKES
ncbi:interferon alpha/beta receptor 1a-like isoform X1 [Clarias gariepinus]|uniref:interferon alpha/beta receptor 1a-like isoform X1 n=1 Tax=Clarias gariepinus TaxID=13013 RepID=UPI00234C3219|nr:interferon alpha/beta receptor 1a-like isoform X1 [Clarias gariepinus]